jgi:S-adenosylmethionine:tRNA ribosyltransferase-isomerase
MNINLFDYHLPDELIAQHPAPRRDSARLFILPRGGEPFSHALINRLPSLLRQGDLLVFNNAKVIPARLYGKKPTSGKVELLILEQQDDRRFIALAKASKGLAKGLIFEVGETRLKALEHLGDGRFLIEIVEPASPHAFHSLLAKGFMPLPPYIRRSGDDAKEASRDRKRYQTVFAESVGAVAAPTAGLHFNARLLARLKAAKINTAFLTLFVGPGTFMPVRAEELEDHQMHEERFILAEEVARIVNKTRDAGGRVIAVGTTSCRTLESCADESGRVRPKSGSTRLFIYPGYRFKVIDGLLTNFHLPKSTLLALVSALVGRERILAAYQEAIAKRYRFFSYGDAMLIH